MSLGDEHHCWGLVQMELVSEFGERMPLVVAVLHVGLVEELLKGCTDQ
jgi:hypothetical protein